MRNRHVKGWVLALLLATAVMMVGSCATSPPAPIPPQVVQKAPEPEPAKPAPPPPPPKKDRGPSLSMPKFPWPPPPSSAETMIPDNWLPSPGAAHLADVANRIEHALKTAKYPMWSYSSVPKGFALVTQMEQIDPEGIPSPEPARWSTDLPSIANMTWFQFLKAMAKVPPGYYRVIVFIITNQPWSRNCEKPTGKDAKIWLEEGFNRLPDSIGKLPYGHDYRTTVLVYEFKKVSQKVDATLMERSLTLADDHLWKAGIYNPLTRP